ncbi:oxygen-independent coproporphyrinogen III oxidase [Flavobacterium sp. MXW15]|uniref:Coproporphyrinogen-III oxidase n=1 Tax=Xanthomonas chitinilytica TaxID=2989819 RepID=A0ABT3JZZ6_9XANT|nr:oxygen-independent coproporphyrinogen III oxidase [Xanthomonas sp. H13-6]MCW4456354.1 oxygen-independent coproporphyrinogen III oxidase [Flavobacterium sp. MXW15]MCW4474060.1 oxygen-independent coproporphyrinogen III oxidase [Xanthomonas sp. H13-6]
MDIATSTAAALGWTFDPEILRRHDRPGPRYTSYPTAPHFHDGYGEAQLRAAAARSNEAGRALSLYVHVPYCTSPCFYCGCNRVITRDVSKGRAYVERVLREADAVAPLFDGAREVVQLHLGGGTPNFLSPELLAEMVDGLGRRFRFSEGKGRDFSIELDPRFVSPEEIGALAQMGFNRASLGVQDFDAEVQKAINREQSVEQTLAIIDACRRHGLRSVNVDLIYGLPRQSLEGFGRTLDTVVAVRPDRLAVYGYAHLPHMFRAQRQIHDADLPGPEQKLALLGLAVRKLSAAGYQYIGMDHFALPEEDLSRAQRAGGLHRNFMGYTTHAQTDLVGLGVSAISHIDDSYSQNPRDLPGWEAAVDAGRPPVWRGLELSADDRLRAELIQQLMCQGVLDTAALGREHGIDFERYFEHELAALRSLQDDGLAEYRDGVIRATVPGRPLLRLIAMCFDRYLQEPAQPARYSRAI